MVKSGNIKVVNQEAVKVLTAEMMALGDAEAGPLPTTAVSHREPDKQRHSGPILVKLVFNWGTEVRYVELLKFEMEVINILHTKVYKLSEEGKDPVIIKWLGKESLQ